MLLVSEIGNQNYIQEKPKNILAPLLEKMEAKNLKRERQYEEKFFIHEEKLKEHERTIKEIQNSVEDMKWEVEMSRMKK